MKAMLTKGQKSPIKILLGKPKNTCALCHSKIIPGKKPMVKNLLSVKPV